MITNSFSTPRAAAIAGLQEAMALARRDGWEYGGMILNNPDGTFSYSKIVTSEDSHGVSTFDAMPTDLQEQITAMNKAAEALPAGKQTLKKDVPPALLAQTEALDELMGKRLSGTFHTHLTHMPWATDITRYFSGRDIFLALKMEHLSWLGLTDSGEVFEIDGRSAEGMRDTAGRIKMRPEKLLLSLLSNADPTENDEVPFAVTGTRVYAGNVQDAQQKAA